MTLSPEAGLEQKQSVAQSASFPTRVAGVWSCEVAAPAKGPGALLCAGASLRGRGLAGAFFFDFQAERGKQRGRLAVAFGRRPAVCTVRVGGRERGKVCSRRDVVRAGVAP